MPLRRRTRENLHAFEKVHSVARCARTGFPGRERGKGTGGRRPTSPPKTTNRGLQKKPCIQLHRDGGWLCAIRVGLLCSACAPNCQEAAEKSALAKKISSPQTSFYGNDHIDWWLFVVEDPTKEVNFLCGNKVWSLVEDDLQICPLWETASPFFCYFWTAVFETAGFSRETAGFETENRRF